MTTSTDTGGSDDTDLFQEFMVDAELQGLSEKSLKTYRSNLRTYLDRLGKDPRQVDRSDLKEFLSYLQTEREALDGSRGVSASTINTYFSALNTFYKFLKYEGYVESNLIPEFRERYIESSRTGGGDSKRQLISVEEMTMLVRATLNVRNRAIIVLLAKTGIRRGELINIDLDDVDWEEQSIKLKSTPKRKNGNLIVFFDGECARVLKRWLRARDEQDPDSEALFTNMFGNRLKDNGVRDAVADSAEAVGLHDPDSDDIEDWFTPHCCRYWFTTHLRRSGMDRKYIQELRGDTRGDNIDIYDHINKQELCEAYLAHIPTLGI